MSVLFIIQHLSDGGAERVVSILASKLAEKGINVSVLLYFPTDNEYELSSFVNKMYLSLSVTEYKALSQVQKSEKLEK